MKKTNFDRYLEEQLKDPDFAARFQRAGEAWDVALQLTALRERAGLSQAQLAALLKTSQQQISRLESPGYEGHSLSMLRRVAKALNARVRVTLEPADSANALSVAEPPAPYAAGSTPPLMRPRRQKLISAISMSDHRIVASAIAGQIPTQRSRRTQMQVVGQPAIKRLHAVPHPGCERQSALC
jgi:transcriptional regulator with XRE-family HTH domain